MSFWLEPELQAYFDLKSGSPPLNPPTPSELQAAAAAAIADDPVLAFMLRLDCALDSCHGVVTCLATVRRNVYHYELAYLERFKQIAEPSVRHPKIRCDQALMRLNPKTLRCGQRVLVKLQTRRHVGEPMRLLRECALLRGSWDRCAALSTAMFPTAYLFGCLGGDTWTVASTDRSDPRQLVIHRRHFLLCQHVEDSLQQLLESNRASGQRIPSQTLARLTRDMLSRLAHLHSLGWSHGRLRPGCFLTGGSGGGSGTGSEELLLLADFVAATPLQPTSLAVEAEAGGSGNPASFYRGERHQRDPRGGFGNAFADLESLIYVACTLGGAGPMPWESDDAAAVRECKLALWRSVESLATEADAAAQNHAWLSGSLGDIFGCGTIGEAEEMPCYRLALALCRLHRDWTTGDGRSARQLDCGSYAPLFDSLKL